MEEARLARRSISDMPRSGCLGRLDRRCEDDRCCSLSPPDERLERSLSLLRRSLLLLFSLSLSLDEEVVLARADDVCLAARLLLPLLLSLSVEPWREPAISKGDFSFL